MTKPRNIIIIVAMARNGVIGAHNKLPWHLPGDLRRFRSLTMGHTLVMGRKTFDSLPNGPLPGRKNVVLSRSGQGFPENVTVVGSIADVLQLIGETIFVIGGGEVYRQLLPYASRIELTFIDKDVDGDTYFPTLDPTDWKIIAEEAFEDNQHQLRGWYRTLERAGDYHNV
ncbi:MAG TPA: dihydrofolate reductase [Bacteroidales bacterium]|nr:dihydrofolate reductase [Bacteroidales bacterium]